MTSPGLHLGVGPSPVPGVRARLPARDAPAPSGPAPALPEAPARVQVLLELWTHARVPGVTTSYG